MRSRTFCCCLPVRFGTFVLALVAILGGLMVSGGSINKVRLGGVEKNERIALWIQAVMFGLLAFVGIFGFLGAILRNRRMVSSFASILAIHLGFSILSGIFVIYAMFTRHTEPAVRNCLAHAQSQGVSISEEDCRKGVTTLKGALIGVYVIGWLIQLYTYFVVERYVDQLDEEQESPSQVVVNVAPQAAPAAEPQMVHVHRPTYTFSAPQHSYGSARRDGSHRV